MPEFLLLLVIALVAAGIVFGVVALASGSDPGLGRVEPDGLSRGLPGTRPLAEQDLAAVRFDVALRGYRMSQVDAAMARAAYDIGFKQEMIDTLRAEVDALREGRTEDAEVLRKAREAAGVTTGRDTGTPLAAHHAAPGAEPGGHPAAGGGAPAASDPEVARAEAAGLAAGEQVDQDRLDPERGA